MRNFEKNTDCRLKTEKRSINVRASGVETHVNSGSRSVNSAHDFPYFYNSDALHLFADLRGRSCVIMTGTTIDVFLTPDQVRFFCARRKAQRKHNRKSLFNRRHHENAQRHNISGSLCCGHLAGCKAHPQTAEVPAGYRPGTRMALSKPTQSPAVAARHEIHRGVSHQRNRKHSFSLPFPVIFFLSIHNRKG